MSTFSQAAAAAKSYGSVSKVSTPTTKKTTTTPSVSASQAASKGKSGVSAPMGGGGGNSGNRITDNGRYPGNNSHPITQSVRQTLSPITQQARLNMMKNPTNPNLPGMHGPGGFAGTQLGSSVREQGAAVSMLAKDMTDRYGMSPDAARDFVTKAARTVAGEAVGEKELGRSLVAKTMLNRMDIGKAVAQSAQYNTDPSKVLRAYDANGMRPGTTPNAQFTQSQPGVDSFVQGLSALNKAVTPGAIPASLGDFTHYREKSIDRPSWESGRTFTTGGHIFSNADYAPDRVAAAQRTVESGLPGDMMAGFQPASYRRPLVEPTSKKMFDDRIPGATDEMTYTSLAPKKVYDDRVPGATDELTYTSFAPKKSGKLFNDQVPGATPERIYTSFVDTNPYLPERSTVPPSNPYLPERSTARPDLTAMAGVSGQAGSALGTFTDPLVRNIRMGTFKEPERYLPENSPRPPAVPATISPMADQGSSWPVQGQEDMWGDHRISDEASSTIENWAKHWDKREAEPPPEVADSGAWGFVDGLKKKATKAKDQLVAAVSAVPGDTPDEQAAVIKAYAEMGPIGAFFASLGTGKPGNWPNRDDPSKPGYIGNSHDKPRKKKKRLPEDETQNSDELLRRYFNGKPV